MNIKWILRFKNKFTATTFAVSLIAFIYLVLSVFGVTPAVSEDQVKTIVLALIDLLGMIGIIVDPTTEGFGDSDLAMTYSEPKPKA